MAGYGLSHRIFSIGLVFLAAFAATARSAPFQSQGETQEIDQEYTRLIREATTRPEFNSPLTDTLPKSDGIPTPLDVLGYIAGAPDELSHYADLVRYFERLAEASPNVRLFSIGTTSEGRDMVAVAVSEASNLDGQPAGQTAIHRLADPREITGEAEADRLIPDIVPAYLLACNMHSSESGSAEAAMELAYRLAVDERPMVKTIRENLIVLIIPSVEPDGHDKHTDWYYKYNRGITDVEQLTRVPYWGRYDMHDNNRDMITMSQPEMKAVADLFFEWLPIVFQDNHESVPYLFLSSANGPSNFPATMDLERNLITWWEVTQMNAYGMPGVHTHDFGNTSWSPNFMASIASNHNATFHFFETFGNAVPTTMEREVEGGRLEKAWYRPVPPYEKVSWSLRNNLNYQITGTLLAQYIVAEQKDFFLKNFWKRGMESFSQGKEKAPFAFVIPSGQKDPVDTAFLINVLLRQKIEVGRVRSLYRLEKQEIPAGSHIVRLDQPYGNLARVLLENQEYPPEAPRAYDDCGWTLGLNMGVTVQAVNDRAVFDAELDPVEGPVRVRSGVRGGPAKAAYLIPHGTVNTLLPARLSLEKHRVLAAEAPFKAAGREFETGSLIIPVAGAAPDLHAAVAAAAETFGLEVFASGKKPDVPSHELSAPRIAVFHTWTSTQDDGWVRFAFDQLKIPFRQINKDHLKKGGLRHDFDVILLSNSGGRSGADLVFEIDPAHRGPLAYTRTDEFPHLGVPDSAPDITGGMGLEGMIELRRFVEEGGVLICLHNMVRVAVDFGLARGIRYMQTTPQFHNPGSLLKGEVIRPEHPIAYGYETYPAILRRHTGPLLSVPEKLERHVVVRYAEEGPVCLSGIVKNQKEISAKPAVIDLPLGEGRVVLFTFNPFWRDTSRGLYAFVFNTVLNWDYLKSLPVPPEVSQE